MDQIAVDFAEQLRLSLKEHVKEIMYFGSRSMGDFSKGFYFDFAVILDQKSRNQENRFDEMSSNLLKRCIVLFGPIIWVKMNGQSIKNNPIK